MLELLYKRRETRSHASIDPRIMQLDITSSVENGTPVRRTEFRKVCVEDNFKQFTIHDFELQSILAVGAVHLLKPVSMNNNDVQSFADNVDMISSQLDNILNHEPVQAQE